MDARPNMGASYYEPKNYIVTSQPQQQQQQDLRHQGQMLPPIPHLLSTDSGSGGTPSFQLTAAAASPIAIGKPTAAASSGVPGGGCYSLTQQLVTPTSPVLGYASRNLPGQQPQSSPSRPQQQQPPPPLNLLNIPIGHAYTYHPSTEHSQTTGLIFNNNPITPTQSAQNVLTSSSLQTQARPRPPRNKSKFKRFRNAFIYYVNDQRVDNETKMLKNREFLRLMSARWKVMSEIERSPYVKLAEADKKRFDDDVKKFGKYESRQRRYNKSRHSNSEILGHNNPYMAGAHQYPATATGMLYNGGFVNMTAHPAHAQANAAATAFPSFYAGSPAGPQGSATNPGNWQQSSIDQMVANGAASALPAGMPHPPIQNSTLLCPPELLAQRTSPSSNGSSNELNEFQQASASPRYPWMPAAARSPGSHTEARKPNPYCQQQPSFGAYMQVPLGAPISHSLTEPVFHGGGTHAQPQISAAVQAQIQKNSALAHQQQQQTLRALNYSLE